MKIKLTSFLVVLGLSLSAIGSGATVFSVSGTSRVENGCWNVIEACPGAADEMFRLAGEKCLGGSAKLVSESINFDEDFFYRLPLCVSVCTATGLFECE